MDAPRPPQPHFPSPYRRPQTAPCWAGHVTTDDGARIAAFVYGRAGGRDDVVFLHGNGEEHGIFGPMVDAVVARGHRAVGIDSRAQGRSTRGDAERLSYELMARDALDVMDRLGMACAHILGFSDGGIEALVLARDHPERVRSLTVLGANLTPGGIIEDEGWDVAGTVATCRAWADWLEGQAGGDVDATLVTPSAAEARQTAELLDLMLREPHIDAEGLGCISCPTTVMAGEFDCVRPQETRTIARSIPGARLRIVAGAGHTLPKEVPDEVCDELLRTLGRAELPIG
ncbi:alpha/beta fold hydrolase [Olsenella uli]|uniref:alpha/beta fold hydrolase n=1 Tax=Olsenella uli TaxID=133926 RepID=UPI00325FAD20